MLWFHDYTVDSGPQFIQVPVSIVQRARIAPTIKFTKDRGYDVRPGDCINVARGPEFSTQGIVESVNFLKAELTFRSDADLSAVSLVHRSRVVYSNLRLDYGAHPICYESPERS
jgi:hypothetical protein